MSSETAPDSSAASPTEPSERVRPRFSTWFRNTFATGLVLVVPLVATIWLLGIGLDFINYFTLEVFGFLGLRDIVPQHQLLGVRVVPFLILVSLTLAAGVFAKHAIGSRFFHIFDLIVLRVPLVSTIYGAVKQVLQTLRGFDGNPNFKYVVYVDYPAPGCRLIGFVTGRYQDPNLGKTIVTVFLPTSPNPLTGFVVAVDSDRVQDCHLSVEEATKLVVSAGLVAPTVESGNRPVPGRKGKAPLPATLTSRPDATN